MTQLLEVQPTNSTTWLCPKNLSVSNSQCCSCLACPRQYYFEYVRQLTPFKEFEYFLWGHLVHEVADTVAQGGTVLGAVKRLYSEAAQKDNQLQRNMCLVLPSVFDAHYQRWGETDSLDYELLQGEQTFEFPLTDTISFCGRIDGIVRQRSTGLVFLLERKTASATGPSYYRYLLWDSQPRGYLLAARRVYGMHINHVLYDVFKKPQIQQAVGEGDTEFAARLAGRYLSHKSQYFERTLLHFTDTEIENHEHWLLRSAKLVRFYYENPEFWQHQHHPFIGACAYESICDGKDEFGPNIEKFYVRKDAHHELGF